MKDILPDFEFSVVDLETTGFSPDSDARIIEVASVKILDGRLGPRFQEFVNPQQPIPEKITRLTGIRDEHVADAETVEPVLRRFHDFADSSILIAHNVPFDRSFIRHYSPRGDDFEWLDTLRLARELCDFSSNSLTALIREFELERERAHRALDDALATARLFLHLVERIQSPEDYLRCGLPPALVEKSDHSIPDLTSSVAFFEHFSPSSEQEVEQGILRAIKELDRAVGVNKLAQILAGSSSQAVEAYRGAPYFGSISSLTQKDLRDRINQLVQRGWLKQSDGPYPVLSVSKEGMSRILKGQTEATESRSPEGPY